MNWFSAAWDDVQFHVHSSLSVRYSVSQLVRPAHAAWICWGVWRLVFMNMLLWLPVMLAGKWFYYVLVKPVLVQWARRAIAVQKLKMRAG